MDNTWVNTGWTPDPTPNYFRVCASLTRQIEAAAGRDATIAAIQTAGDCTWQELAQRLSIVLDDVTKPKPGVPGWWESCPEVEF